MVQLKKKNILFDSQELSSESCNRTVFYSDVFSLKTPSHDEIWQKDIRKK